MPATFSNNLNISRKPSNLPSFSHRNSFSTRNARGFSISLWWDEPPIFKCFVAYKVPLYLKVFFLLLYSLLFSILFVIFLLMAKSFNIVVICYSFLFLFCWIFSKVQSLLGRMECEWERIMRLNSLLLKFCFGQTLNIYH